MILVPVAQARNTSSAVVVSNKKNEPVMVAVGIVIDANQRIFIMQRRPATVGGGHWEFPGGKVEKDESVYQALCRELKEEINVEVKKADELIVSNFSYPTYNVMLHTYLITAFTGEPKPMEGQPCRWVTLRELDQYNFLEGNVMILTALKRRLNPATT